MAILFTAFDAETVWISWWCIVTWCCVGNLAPSSGFILLYTGQSIADGAGTTDYMYYAWYLFCLCLYENREYLGSSNIALFE